MKLTVTDGGSLYYEIVGRNGNLLCRHDGNCNVRRFKIAPLQHKIELLDGDELTLVGTIFHFRVIRHALPPVPIQATPTIPLQISTTTASNVGDVMMSRQSARMILEEENTAVVDSSFRWIAFHVLCASCTDYGLAAADVCVALAQEVESFFRIVATPVKLVLFIPATSFCDSVALEIFVAKTVRFPSSVSCVRG